MRRTVGWIGGALLASCLLAGCQPSPANGPHNLILSGSRSMGPMMAEIGKRFEAQHPDIRINVDSYPGDRAVGDTRQGLADIGMLGRLLRPEESGLHPFPIAHDGLAFIVNRDNPVESLAEGQIVGLFTGVYANWKEVGGPDRPVKLAGQGEGRAARDVFLDYFGLRAAQVRADPAVASSEQAIQAVATHPFAIGYASAGPAEKAALKLPIRILSLGGVLPTYDNVLSGRYSLVRPLQLLTREAPSGIVREFIDFARLAEVHDLIKQHGFVPLPP
jgi:phosphate transport system substrate-binding protein